jgi:xanthine/uracil permease
MIGIAFQSILKDPLDQRRLTILGVTLLFGVGLMFQPSTVFQGLPTSFQYVSSNGLLIGTIIAIVLEQIWRKQSA